MNQKTKILFDSKTMIVVCYFNDQVIIVWNKKPICSDMYEYVKVLKATFKNNKSMVEPIKYDELIRMITELVSSLPVTWSLDEKQKVYNEWLKKYEQVLKSITK